MKLLLCGETGTGKTDIAYKLYNMFFNLHVIDGDELRNQFNNYDYSSNGRLINHENCSKICKKLDDLNYHIVVSMQSPTPELRKKYFSDFIKVRLTNLNNTKKIANEIKPTYDYSTEIDYTFEYTDIKDNIHKLINVIFPKVLIIGRFQPLHKGHDIIFKTANKLSPYIDVSIRKESNDIFELSDVEQKIRNTYPFINNIIKNKCLHEENWVYVNNYDYVVQGNNEVIDVIKPYLKNKETSLVYVERISNISGTQLRKMIQSKEK